tara:strand:- start:210 stop:386 length:177 start_codon:yes stop_codon:yes gene_type:complete
MKPGDLVKINNNWHHKIAVVLAVWGNHKGKPTTVDLLLDDGTTGNIIAGAVEVISEAR